MQNINLIWFGLIVVLSTIVALKYLYHENFRGFCPPNRVAVTSSKGLETYRTPQMEPRSQIGGYPFAFLDQLDSTRSAYAPRPNCWPKGRRCDLEWNRCEAEDPCKRLDLPTYFGSGIPIKTDQTCTRESDSESMFYFKNFRCSPECCPSPYSCDGGCVCAFEKKVCEKWPQDLSQNPQRITFQ